MKSRNIALLIIASVVTGIAVGTFFTRRLLSPYLNVINVSTNKVGDLLHIVDEMYVDSVNVDDMVEQVMPQVLKELDPIRCTFLLKISKIRMPS